MNHRVAVGIKQTNRSLEYFSVLKGLTPCPKGSGHSNKSNERSIEGKSNKIAIKTKVRKAISCVNEKGSRITANKFLAGRNLIQNFRRLRSASKIKVRLFFIIISAFLG